MEFDNPEEFVIIIRNREWGGCRKKGRVLLRTGFEKLKKQYFTFADVAQQAVQLPLKQQGEGSTPSVSANWRIHGENR